MERKHCYTVTRMEIQHIDMQVNLKLKLCLCREQSKKSIVMVQFLRTNTAFHVLSSDVYLCIVCTEGLLTIPSHTVQFVHPPFSQTFIQRFTLWKCSPHRQSFSFYNQTLVNISRQWGRSVSYSRIIWHAKERKSFDWKMTTQRPYIHIYFYLSSVLYYTSFMR